MCDTRPTSRRSSFPHQSHCSVCRGSRPFHAHLAHQLLPQLRRPHCSFYQPALKRSFITSTFVRFMPVASMKHFISSVASRYVAGKYRMALTLRRTYMSLTSLPLSGLRNVTNSLQTLIHLLKREIKTQLAGWLLGTTISPAVSLKWRADFCKGYLYNSLASSGVDSIWPSLWGER